MRMRATISATATPWLRRRFRWRSRSAFRRRSVFLRGRRFQTMVSLLDIIGPVMVGPSSSHTAGAWRLGLLARGLVGGTPDRARVELHGSFARTGEGHGTDKAIVAGLMGFRPDDDRIRTALDIAAREGLDYRFEKTTLDEEAHPNTVRITLERGDRKAVMIGSSLGAGRVLVTQ